MLTAIITPAVLYPRSEHIELGIANEYLVAAVISSLVAWRTRNVLITIVVGMAALLGWRWLMTVLYCEFPHPLHPPEQLPLHECPLLLGADEPPATA